MLASLIVGKYRPAVVTPGTALTGSLFRSFPRPRLYSREEPSASVIPDAACTCCTPPVHSRLPAHRPPRLNTIRARSRDYPLRGTALPGLQPARSPHKSRNLRGTVVSHTFLTPEGSSFTRFRFGYKIFIVVSNFSSRFFSSFF